MNRRLAVRLALGVLVVAAAWGHLWFWYWPREHALVLDGGRLPGSLLGDDRFAQRIWIPYPHQNLGRLAQWVEDPEELLAAAARLIEASPPRLPGFGPFRIPPARELGAAYGGESGGVVVAARLYPLMAAVGRLAGRVAANPWLAGGVVSWQGRRSEVRWQGTLWILESGGLEASPPAAISLPGPSALGGVSLDDAGSLLGGPLLLRRVAGGGLELGGGGESSPLPGAEELLSGETFLVALNGHGGPVGEAPSALVLQRVEATPFGELPSAAVLHVGEGERFLLPAERLAELLGLELHRGSVAGFELLALDSRALAAAERLAPETRRRVESGHLRLALWLEPAPLVRFATRVRSTLEAIPLVPRREIQPWRDVETLLGPLAGYRWIVAVASQRGSTLRLEPEPPAN